MNVENAHIDHPEISHHNLDNFRVGLERIGDGIALVMNNIRLTKTSQRNIFTEVIDPSENMTFDYVNLATDEIDPETKSHRKLIFEFIQEHGRGYYLKQKLLDIFRPVEEKVIFNYLRTKLNTSLNKQNETWFLHPKSQDRDIDEHVLINLYTDRNSAAAKRVQNAIKRNIKKPFLVIYGHGYQPTTHEKTGPEWYIGERSTSNYVSINDVFKHLHIDDGKYSAVILLSCNEAEMFPPTTNTPVIFVKGLAGEGLQTHGKLVSEWYKT